MGNFKFYSKTALAAVFRWLMLSGAGVVLSVTGIIVGLALLGNNVGSGYSGAKSGSGLGAIVSVFVLFRDEFWTAMLIFASIALVAVYFMVASKFTIGFILHRLLEHKLLPVIGTKVAATLRGFSAKQSKGLPSFANAEELKKKLAHLVSQDSDTNKIQRKVIHYGLKKIDLHDIDFTQKDLNVSDEVSNRLMRRLAEAANPGYRVFGIVFAVHLSVLILALIFDHH